MVDAVNEAQNIIWIKGIKDNLLKDCEGCYYNNPENCKGKFVKPYCQYKDITETYIDLLYKEYPYALSLFKLSCNHKRL